MKMKDLLPLALIGGLFLFTNRGSGNTNPPGGGDTGGNNGGGTDSVQTITDFASVQVGDTVYYVIHADSGDEQKQGIASGWSTSHGTLFVRDDSGSQNNVYSSGRHEFMYATRFLV